MATFTPTEEFSLYSFAATLTLNGEDIAGVSDGYAWAFTDSENCQAFVYEENAWMIEVIADAEPDAHVVIVQAEPIWVTLYQGTVTVIEQNHVCYGTFNSDAVVTNDFSPIRGTVNGVEVSGTFGSNGRADLTGTSYYIVSNGDSTFNFGAPDVGDYVLNLEIVEGPESDDDTPIA